MSYDGTVKSSLGLAMERMGHFSSGNLIRFVCHVMARCMPTLSECRHAPAILQLRSRDSHPLPRMRFRARDPWRSLDIVGRTRQGFFDSFAS